MNARDEWLKVRRGGPGDWRIGGSEAAAVLGWDKRCNRLQLWAEKRGLIEREAGDDSADAGRYLESGILRWYEARTDRRIVTPGQLFVAMSRIRRGHVSELDRLRLADGSCGDSELDGLIDHVQEHADIVHAAEGQVVFRSKLRPWQTMTPDAFAIDSKNGYGIVDAKMSRLSFRKDWSDGIPAYRSPQLAHYVDGFGAHWGGFAVVFGGLTIEWWDVSVEELAPVRDLVVDECERFIADHLETGSPPLPEASERSAAVLSKLYPPGRSQRIIGWTGPFAMADATWLPEQFDAEFEEVEATYRVASKRRAELESVIRAVAGGAAEVRLPGGVSYSFARGVKRKEKKR